jgi:UDP-N-acetylmuramyl pentapeptide phosphotransferase/UDP-N-acetylglucosamine-1-phosphate transferase
MTLPGLAFLLPLLSFAVALFVVRGAIAYAHRRGMLDQPGQRRSHTLPTPRGGGIGVVVAVLLLLPACAWLDPVKSTVLFWTALWTGFLLVALVGWWDDHHPLPVVPRLLVQAAASVLVAVAMLLAGTPWWWMLPLVVAGVGSINLHNFMDGIDGLLAQQIVFVMLGMAVIAAVLSLRMPMMAMLVVAAACAGFWCYNRSPARIFMGDVGSGSLGFLVFGFGALLWQADTAAVWPAATLCSLFVTDAGMTLAVRIWRGRRWYSAHREHLYQWMVRRGRGHGVVAATYTAWNLAVCMPLAVFAWRLRDSGWWVCLATYGLSAVTWILLKRRCLDRTREWKS